MRIEHQDLPPEILEEVLQSISHHLAPVRKPRVILSDIDYTLFSEYGFNPATNDHLPKITPEAIAAARPLHLVPATGRRTDNPTIPLLWESGFLPEDIPIITENGGMIVRKHGSRYEYINLVPSDEMGLLADVQQQIAEAVHDIPSELKLIFKKGRTLLVARLQDAEGLTMPIYQRWLDERIAQLDIPARLSVVNSRVSVTIQSASVTKQRAFHHYLEMEGIARENIFVIGMGDGENDESIFNEADLRIGFSSAVRQWVDIYVPHGASVTPEILKAIHRSGEHHHLQREIGTPRRIAASL